MTFGSLFAGIGGFDLGLERAGMICKWQVEIDPYCNKILEKHWPNVKRYEDIKTVGSLEYVDLICGGFPCQPFSQAGKQKGHEDDRYLWPEMLRVITQARPAWILGENVAGIVGLALDRVLLDLENTGYTTRTFIIPACAVDARHRRDRVWIVANRTDSRTQSVRGWQDSVSEDVANADNLSGRIVTQPNERRLSQGNGKTGCQWLPEPDVGRVAHGIPRRVDRLKGLGNAVVPQIVEVIGKAIIKANNVIQA